MPGQDVGLRQPGHRRHPAGREGDAEGARHHVGSLVGLVEDEHVVLGEDVAARRHVGAEQVEVDHDDVGLPRPLVGGLGEAILAAGALLGPGALVGPDAHRRPRRRGRLEVQLGPVAGLAVLGPRQQPGHLAADGAGAGATGVAVADRQAQLALVAGPADLQRRLPAEVVAAALEHGPRQPRPQPGGGDRREVLAGQLVLQGLGGGGDDDLAVPGPQECPGQVRPRLAGTRAGPDHQRPVVANRLRHRLGHGDLPGPDLAAACQPRRQGLQGGCGVDGDCHRLVRRIMPRPTRTEEKPQECRGRRETARSLVSGDPPADSPTEIERIPCGVEHVFGTMEG